MEDTETTEAQPPVEAPPALRLDCTLEGATVQKLLRHPALGPHLPRPVRWRAEQRTWFDADGLDDSLAIERRRREPPTLVRCLPPEDEPGLPGTWPEAGGDVPPEPHRPLAAFIGRRLAFPLGPVQVEILQGRMRAVANERPLVRLVLSGAPAACCELAAALARDLPLLPATEAPAEIARALAEERPPRPRRAGAPQLGDAATVAEGFRAAAGHLLDVLLAEAPGCRLSAGPRGVHQSRVALRRLRSVLKVFRPAFDGHAIRAWDAELGALARRLGAARDWDVFLEGTGAALAEALDGDQAVPRLIQAAERERALAYAALAETLAGGAFRASVWHGVSLLADLDREWEPQRPEAAPDAPLPAFGALVLRRRWKRLRAAGAAVEELPPAALHELRLDVKRLRYAAELFAALWPGKAPRRLLRRLAALQEALGRANDAVVARALADSLPDIPAFARGAVAGFTAGRAAGSREEALREWDKLLQSKRFWKSVPAA